LNFLDRFFEKFSNITFHENSSSGSRTVPRRRTDGRTDRHTEATNRGRTDGQTGIPKLPIAGGRSDRQTDIPKLPIADGRTDRHTEATNRRRTDRQTYRSYQSRTDGQTDIPKPPIAFHKFANLPIKANTHTVDVAIPADRNVVQKEAEKKVKYKRLCTKIPRMWNLLCVTIPVG
jgi:hypothetical protein